MLTATEAGAIAARHKLSLSDAAALAQLCSSADEADQLARQFVDAASTGVERGAELWRERNGTAQ